MTYETLADRVDDELLTATYLSALSRNTAHVYGMARQPNMAFQGYQGSITTMSKTTCTWLYRHYNDYLHYNIAVGDDITYLRIKACLVDDTGTVTLYSNADPGATHSFDTYVDVSSNLTPGNWYKVWVELTYDDAGSHSTYVYLLAESDATSLGTSTASSYSAPEEWTDHEAVTHTKMNTYKTALDAAHSIAGDEKCVLLTRANNTSDGAGGYRGGFWFVHRFRWLHFVGTQVEIVDPNGTFDAVEETDSPVDLYSVDWLADGAIYEVKDCIYCVEDSSA